jgi:pyridoxine 4-dehydrogenase
MPINMITAESAGTWTLGDLTVNRIGFGAMRLTGDGSAASDRARVVGVLRRAVELGVNHIDTAAFYFSPLRSANELINTALAPYADDLVIATKVGPGRDPSGEWLPLARPDQLRGQVEENLRQLGRDHLDVVNLRQHGLESVAEHFGALAELRDAGLIRHLGLSNIRPQHLAQAQAIAPVVCVQNPYGVDTRRMHDEFVRTCGPSPAPAIPTTWWRTWPRGRCGCPPRSWPASTSGTRRGAALPRIHDRRRDAPSSQAVTASTPFRRRTVPGS